MSRSTPSLLALLGLVAFAGYQNRGKISEMMADAQSRRTQTTGGPSGLMSEIGAMFRSGTAGGTLSTGLSDLVKRFKSAGQGKTAESWVADGPNEPLSEDNLASAIGDETLAELAQKTGLSRTDLLSRLSAAIPQTVDKLTPDAHLPTADEAEKLA